MPCNHLKIKDYKLVEKVFRKDRWYAILDKPFNGYKRMPYAHYVWLLGNPGFVNVPSGYVVHHLDYDEINDDISNLVIMQKHHHLSYHLKQKTIKSKVKVEVSKTNSANREYSPTRKPKVRKQAGKYYIDFYERSGGASHRVRLFTWKGKPFLTEQSAKRIANNIYKKPSPE